MLISNDMAIFKARKIKDPHTGQERILTPEEQELLLQKGVLLDLPTEEMEPPQKDKDNVE